MARFRRSGHNWEGRSWTVSPSLAALIDEIEAAYPAGHKTDGTVASKAHDQDNPMSDHRPYPYSGPGVVNAVDAGEVTENDAFAIADAIRRSRDSRLLYAIHEGRIFSSYVSGTGVPTWTWRPYSGPSPHPDHVHVSVRRANQGNGTPWGLDLGGDMDKIPVEWWAVDAFNWAISNKFYTEQTDINKIRESYDIQQMVVMQHRTWQRLIAMIQAGGNGVTPAQVKELIKATRLTP